MISSQKGVGPRTKISVLFSEPCRCMNHCFQYNDIRYHTSGGISGRVGHLNPHWNEKDVDADERYNIYTSTLFVKLKLCEK